MLQKNKTFPQATPVLPPSADLSPSPSSGPPVQLSPEPGQGPAQGQPRGEEALASSLLAEVSAAGHAEVQRSTARGGRLRGPASMVGGWLTLAVRWLVAGNSSAWLVSLLIHLSLVLALSWLVFAQHQDSPRGMLTGILEEAPIDDVLDLETEALVVATGGWSTEMAASQGEAVGAAVAPSSALVRVPKLVPWSATGERVELPAAETIGQPLLQRGGGLDGRSAGSRRQLALAGGGTAASEAAVERGLAWLAAHQWQDGGWRFDLGATPACQGACRNSGNFESTTASTGLALLCFLGAGYTPREGPYQELVARGLYYLSERMISTSFGGDLRDGEAGTMYAHAIATLALCEAYAMTGDENLAGPAQAAIDFIVNAQHEKGGWRYFPGAPGDTTVTGWQVAALKSGLLANLKVPYDVWRKVSAFLDSVQLQRGAAYGYKGMSQVTTTTTAIGLFGRMMLGWPRDHRPLSKGMAGVAARKPSQSHSYFNYYATMILHHFGGKGWERWNVRMREYLLKSQASAGHERGSWYFEEPHSGPGGRLYTTTMAIMMLEVYYRYMPLYQDAMIDRAP